MFSGSPDTGEAPAMMDQDSLREIESRCTQESPPRCRAACPFDLDARAFLARMAEGKTGEARKLLERHLPLPGILARICDHPCEDACLRRDLGGSVALHGLELACMRAAGSRERTLPLPPKRFRMAVVGAGLAGLAAAWDLARKAYPVTVLFHAGEPWQALLSRWPQLGLEGAAGDLLAGDMEELSRKKVSFQQAESDSALLERLSVDYDAVLLDADAACGLAPEESHVDAETLVWRDNICCAGWLDSTLTGHTFASPSRQAGQGRQAAQSMERLAGKLSLTAGRGRAQGRLHTDVAGIAPVPRVEPALATDGEGLYSPEEAAAEARRCLQCECMICVRQCVYMQKYEGYPRLYARQVHNNASIVKGLHTANALVNGCSLCGQCTELCPENFSMAELCLAAREDMVERGYMPPSAHEFALEDMENASGPDCSLVLPDSSVPDAPSWLFFPGCQMAASRGAQLAELYGWLRESLGRGDTPGVALMLSCCGIPARWAGRKRLFGEHMARLRAVWENLGQPRIMAACASCLAAFREGFPEAQAISVWEVMDGMDISGLRLRGTAANSPDLPPVFSLHDPCTARHDASWLASVRSLVAKAGVAVEEPAFSGTTTACCGYGGLVWCAQPQLAAAMSAHRAAAMAHPGLASCVMCRDRLAAGGKACWHVLDILLPGVAAPSGEVAGPGLSARRANRAALRRFLLAQHGEAEAGQEVSPCVLGLAPGLLERLESRHILLSDVEAAVAGVEAGGQNFENVETGRLLGSWRPRNVTFWVEYERRDGALVLHDAWSHRMTVPGSGGHTGGAASACCTDGGLGELP